MLPKRLVLIDDRHDRKRPVMLLVLLVETVPNVARRAPQVADVPGPLPRLCRAPFANREDNIASCGAKRIGHQRIGFLGIAISGEAPVVLQIIDAPARILDCVLILMTLAARALAAGHPSGIRVDPELQAFRVDVIGERLDAGWKL